MSFDESMIDGWRQWAREVGTAQGSLGEIQTFESLPHRVPNVIIVPRCFGDMIANTLFQEGLQTIHQYNTGQG